MIKSLFLSVGAACWFASSAAASAATPCVTTTEATSIALVAMPELIQQVGQICAGVLPPASLVRQTGGAFLVKYQIEADRAWPAARAALARVAGPDIAPLLQSDFTRPMLTSLLGPALIGTVQPKDCRQIDHMATLLQPLPARNTAGLIVSALQFAREKQAQFGNPGDRQTLDIPICPADRR
ncbi:hypothetical protein EAH79_03780 [Sphingomonas koreensis]|nr:hypothetical protein EAH79_03780 [Sphingomonas koreensis]